MEIPGKGSLSKVQQYKERLLDKHRAGLREKAIKKVKARLALQQKNIEDFSEDEREDIVRDEEEKIKKNLMNSALVVLLIALGIH